ncbi:MAG: TlpA family protein disulfide reductase [Sporocytophaga sp.]|uniref:redoxin domain-containing protein n=1 Tax=Sporocytophaga sp. TaxID=2231183 RepID=UPI001B10E90F|nr:redoxin domain-containing protein [Sporocytophaga sp.]MBO9699599.1 TlpA family protein disulfide reductase [Sporocytophaga sp.]
MKSKWLKTIILLAILSSSFFFSFAQPKVGQKAPDFEIEDPNGKTIHLSDLTGKVVLLDFWASWCMPCREANPEVVAIYQKYHDKGFEIFSVSLDTKREAWLNAIKKDQLSWPNHGSDLKGWENAVAELYEVSGIPATFLIDEKGFIIGTDLDEYDLDKKLNFLFNEQVQFYPQTAAGKLFFTTKAKYQIEDLKGNILLKGKSEEVDITGLAASEYVVRYEDKTSHFLKKVSDQSLVTFYPQRVDDKLTLSKNANFEIYNQRGKLIKKGAGAFIMVQDLASGNYYLSLEGTVSTFFKK